MLKKFGHYIYYVTYVIYVTYEGTRKPLCQ